MPNFAHQTTLFPEVVDPNNNETSAPSCPCCFSLSQVIRLLEVNEEGVFPFFLRQSTSNRSSKLKTLYKVFESLKEKWSFFHWSRSLWLMGPSQSKNSGQRNPEVGSTPTSLRLTPKSSMGTSALVSQLKISEIRINWKLYTSVIERILLRHRSSGCIWDWNPPVAFGFFWRTPTEIHERRHAETSLAIPRCGKPVERPGSIVLRLYRTWGQDVHWSIFLCCAYAGKHGSTELLLHYN